MTFCNLQTRWNLVLKTVTSFKENNYCWQLTCNITLYCNFSDLYFEYYCTSGICYQIVSFYVSFNCRSGLLFRCFPLIDKVAVFPLVSVSIFGSQKLRSSSLLSILDRLGRHLFIHWCAICRKTRVMPIQTTPCLTNYSTCTLISMQRLK